MIELDPRLKTPLYEQLYAALARYAAATAPPARLCQGGAPWPPSRA